jgi:hypothetical protein
MNLYEQVNSDFIYGPLSAAQVSLVQQIDFIFNIGFQQFIGTSVEEPELERYLVPRVVEEIDINVLKLTKLNEINLAYDSAVSLLVAGTPAFERESWAKQETEANVFELDPLAETPYVDNLATVRGIPRSLLLVKIKEKVILYTNAHSLLTGKRQALEDTINNEATTVEELQALSFD